MLLKYDVINTPVWCVHFAWLKSCTLMSCGSYACVCEIVIKWYALPAVSSSSSTSPFPLSLFLSLLFLLLFFPLPVSRSSSSFSSGPHPPVPLSFLSSDHQAHALHLFDCDLLHGLDVFCCALACATTFSHCKALNANSCLYTQLLFMSIYLRCFYSNYIVLHSKGSSSSLCTSVL